MIAYGYPAIRDVPCTNNARPIDPMFAREYGKMAVRLLARKTTTPVLRALGIGPGLGREFSDVAAQVRSEPALIDDLLRPMMNAGVYPADLFDNAGINALVDEHYNRGADHAILIALIISWGIASQALVGGSESASFAA